MGTWIENRENDPTRPEHYSDSAKLLQNLYAVLGGAFLQYLGLASGQHGKHPFTWTFPMSLYLSMAAFALAASISPGPVNIVALGSGARHGLRASLAHVAGATLGFCLLLMGLALKLASDDGQLGGEHQQRAPSAWEGPAMQWLFTWIYGPKCFVSVASSHGNGRHSTPDAHPQRASLLQKATPNPARTPTPRSSPCPHLLL